MLKLRVVNLTTEEIFETESQWKIVNNGKKIQFFNSKAGKIPFLEVRKIVSSILSLKKKLIECTVKD